MNSKHEFRFEVTSMDDSIPCRVLYFKKPGQYCYTQDHMHSSIEIDYVVSGCMNVELDGKLVTICDDDYIVINSNYVHNSIVPDENSQLSYLVLIFSEKYMKAYFSDCESYDFNVNKNPEIKEEIHSCLKRIVEVIETQKKFIDLSVSVLTAHILELLFLHCAEVKNVQKTFPFNDTSIAAERYIHEYFREKITASDVARHVGFTTQYFSKTFKESHGYTFQEYLTRVRLNHALIDLKTGKVNQTQAALNNGFSSIKAFITAFKKYFKCTLCEYKKATGIIPSFPSPSTGRPRVGHYVDKEGF